MRLAVCLLLAAALCLCVRLGLLPILLAAHLFVDGLTGVLVDCLAGLSELLYLLLVALLLRLLNVLGVPNRLLCRDAGDLRGLVDLWSGDGGLNRSRSVLRLPENHRTHCREEKSGQTSHFLPQQSKFFWRNKASLLARRRYLWQRGSGKLVTLAGCG